MRRYVTSVGLAVFVGLGILLVHSAIVEALEWREEVALHDGGTTLVNGWMQFVAGEPFQTMPAARRLTFNHPGTGQRIVWESDGKIGSRVNPRLLDFDGGRAFLVTTAQAGPDYDGFGGATTSTWKTRVLRRSRRASASSLCLKTFSATLTA